jgi:hypothetical protein
MLASHLLEYLTNVMVAVIRIMVISVKALIDTVMERLGYVRKEKQVVIEIVKQQSKPEPENQTPSLVIDSEGKLMYIDRYTVMLLVLRLLGAVIKATAQKKFKKQLESNKNDREEQDDIPNI